MNERLVFKHFPVKKSCMINIHERGNVIQQRINNAAQNNEDETNEPCCVHFKNK